MYTALMNGIAHQASDQAHDAVGGEDARGRIAVAGSRRAFHVVHRLDEIVDPERDRGDQDQSQEIEAGEHMTERRQRHREPEVGKRLRHVAPAHATHRHAERGSGPGDGGAHRDRDEPGGDALPIADAAEPARQDDRKAHDADDRRHVHLFCGPHRDERNRHAGERAEQRGARRDPAHDRRHEAAGHQHEALHEHPHQTGLPALHGVAGLDRDRQHDHEHDDEHVRHADAGGQRAHVGSSRLLRKAIREPRVVHRGQRHHQSHRGENASEHQVVRHLEHEAQEPGQHQHVHQDVGAETEERVPVARRPQRRFVRGHGHGSPASNRDCPHLIARNKPLGHALLSAADAVCRFNVLARFARPLNARCTIALARQISANALSWCADVRMKSNACDGLEQSMLESGCRDVIEESFHAEQDHAFVFARQARRHGFQRRRAARFLRVSRSRHRGCDRGKSDSCGPRTHLKKARVGTITVPISTSFTC